MPFLKKCSAKKMTEFFQTFFLVKKIIPQCIKNDRKKNLTLQNIEKKNLPNNFFLLIRISQKKN